jgi:hypothetical protein
MTALLTLLLLTSSFPANSLTSWMRPEAFHLRIGMGRGEAVRVLDKWQPKPGKHIDEIVVDYSGEKALTLEFKANRLHSVRFELFAFLPEVRKAFAEEKARLKDTLGEPRKSTKAILIYDRLVPNVMVVLSDDAKSPSGKQGFGMLAVRYFDPAATSIPGQPSQTAPATPPAGQ